MLKLAIPLYLFLNLTLAHSMAFSAEEIKVAASATAQSKIFSKIKADFEKESGIKLNIITNDKGFSSVQVYYEVDKGNAEIGASGLDWDSWKKALAKDKVEASHLAEFSSQPVGRDTVQFFTYPGGPKELSDQQIADILMFKTTNWKQAGGEDKEITVAYSIGVVALNTFLEERLLGGKKFDVKKAKPIEDNQALAQFVSKTPGAFGFLPSNLVTGEVNKPQHSVLGKPITILFRGKPSTKLATLIKFLQENALKYGYK